MDNINHDNNTINNNSDEYYCCEYKNIFSFNIVSKFYRNTQNIESDENNCSRCILSGEYVYHCTTYACGIDLISQLVMNNKYGCGS